MKKEHQYPRALTIAGSDSGGGAGIQADLKTFSALGCYGMSVITALTAQNTLKVHSIFEVSSEFVKEQLDAVLTDIGADAIKIGMLHSCDLIQVVADRLSRYPIQAVVLDPVMVSKSGDRLLQDDAVMVLKELLIPQIQILTPNLLEASVLLKSDIRSTSDMEEAAKKLLSLGPEIVVLKGGHSESSQSDDYVCYRESNSNITGEWLRAERVSTVNTHGTGCTFSSAITAFLAQGGPPIAAIRQAKNYLSGAIRAGASYSLGQGHGPVHHFYQLDQEKV